VCDACSVTLFSLSVGAIVGMGPYWTFVSWIAGIAPFLMAHWEEYYLGELVLGIIDNPTEAEIGFTIIALLTGVLGQYIWHWEAFGIQFFEVLVGLVVLGSIFTCSKNCFKVVRGQPHREGTTLALLFAELLPLASLISMSICWVLLSPDIFLLHPRVFISNLGIIFSILVTRLIVQRICKEQPALFYPILVPLFVAVINAIIGRLFLHGVAPIPELIVLWISFALAAINFGCLALSLIHELCYHLKIRCFVIPYPPPRLQDIELHEQQSKSKEPKEMDIESHEEFHEGPK